MRPDLTGQRFGRLVVIKAAGLNQYGNCMWFCQCDCGGEATTREIYLTNGHTKSCGCVAKEKVKARCTTHGASKRGHRAPEYRSWEAMKRRCFNAKDPKYPKYGARGITVCDQWRTSYETFLADMGPKPSPKHTLDREDNDGSYEPGNCRWATPIVQMNNQSKTIKLTVGDRTQSLADWARERGMKQSTIRDRVKSGWPPARALELENA